MLFERLKDAAGQAWEVYTRHPFVLQLGEGTLPESAFRQYLIQDYHFLIHFARAYALAGYKAGGIEDLRRAKSGMVAILDTELGLHVDYCAKWGISEADIIAAPEAEPCLAYTRYVLERGMAGTLLDLHVALAPCMLGYEEIARWLLDQPWLDREDNPYAAWIAMYSSADYREAAAEERGYLDRLAARENISDARMADLGRTFTEATRLEARFWQMGFDLASTEADRV
ncbi:thiaminase II [Marivibrio halodurans]|uniref:Aminopyrimidine aminohydrolase n=1 Tax=Marivibrio halodurans TaxID=2039722 RepID=A0A8J7S418_9PROT|nr:thiaminase II [Marivibrio halodurans]MBP5858329.1 thiaminase II [Marivibrio halodurans]